MGSSLHWVAASSSFANFHFGKNKQGSFVRINRKVFLLIHTCHITIFRASYIYFEILHRHFSLNQICQIICITNAVSFLWKLFAYMISGHNSLIPWPTWSRLLFLLVIAKCSLYLKITKMSSFSTVFNNTMTTQHEINSYMIFETVANNFNSKGKTIYLKVSRHIVHLNICSVFICDVLKVT